MGHRLWKEERNQGVLTEGAAINLDGEGSG